MPETSTLEETDRKTGLGEIRKDPFTGTWPVIVKNTPPNKRLGKIIAEYPSINPVVIVHSPAEPVLKIETKSVVTGYGSVYDSRAPTGAHEILAYDPDHPSMLECLLMAFRDRILELRTVDGVKYISAFLEPEKKQDGKPIAEVVAFPVVIPAIKDEIIWPSMYYNLRDRCFWCDATKEETKAGERTIYEDDSVLSIVPYSQRYEIEAHLFTRKHIADFGYMDDQSLNNLAYALDKTIKKMESHFKEKYYIDVHTIPLALPMDPRFPPNKEMNNFFHAHIEVTSASSNPYGRTGIYRLKMSPEKLAELLRETKI